MFFEGNSGVVRPLSFGEVPQYGRKTVCCINLLVLYVSSRAFHVKLLIGCTLFKEKKKKS